MSEERSGVGKGLLSSAALVAAVVAIMITGMILRTDGRTEATGPAAAPPPSPAALPLGSEIKPEAHPDIVEAAPPEPPAVEPHLPPAPVLKELARPAPEPAADPLLNALAKRAEADSLRLAKLRGRWTAQLLVACKPETVDRFLAGAGASDRIYVLPARVKDDACFRVCYGDYPAQKDAAAAADLPQALRGKEKIGAAEIAKVLP